MKIADIECHAVQSPHRTFVVVLVKTDEGLVGVGEAGLQRRWKAIEGVISHFKQWLIGEDPMRIEHLWQRMYRGGFYPADCLIGSAVSAIDIALWDIKGQALGVPVYELLGGRCRDYVECFTMPDYLVRPSTADRGNLLGTVDKTGDPLQAAELAKQCRQRGHQYFRLGMPAESNRFEPRRSAQRLVHQLRAVRDAVGDDLELMVDLHTRLEPSDAIDFCQQVEPLRLFAVEDPIRSEYKEGYGLIRQNTRVPIAAGEQWCSKWEFQAVIERNWIDFARVDICIAGGLTEAKKIAAMAETHLIRLLPHNPLGPICTAASLHLDLACNNAGPQEVLFPPEITLPDVFECMFKIRDFRITPPSVPGLGVKFNVEAARAYPPQMTEPPHFHRGDGAFTNY